MAVWLITRDGGRAVNLDRLARIEASGSGDKRELTFFLEDGGAGTLAADLTEDDVSWVMGRIAAGEGVDLRLHDAEPMVAAPTDE